MRSRGACDDRSAAGRAAACGLAPALLAACGSTPAPTEPSFAIATDCADCHTGGHYTGTSADCYACHAKACEHADGHPSNGYPHACATSHGTSGWEPAAFTGHDAFWPLTGQHGTAGCSACHGGGICEGTPTERKGCHTPDGNSTADPSHAKLALPKACETCHTTASWAATSFPDHDSQFPITSGNHEFCCARCHKGATWAAFTCIGCHTLGQMNSEHIGEVSNCQATLNTAPTTDHGCLTCHPNGVKGDD